MGAFRDLKGQKFGNWKVLYLSSCGSNKPSMWHCECLLCHNEYNISSYSLTSGISTKCRSCSTKLAKTKSYSGDPIKIIFKGMKQRCYNKNTRSYKNYGEKNINICDQWLENPESFYKWAYDNNYQKGLSIERKDVSKNYCPDNCIFIAKEDQPKNRSISHMITLNGKTQCLSDWCRELNLPYSTISARIQHGIPYEEALFTPIGKAKFPKH